MSLRGEGFSVAVSLVMMAVWIVFSLTSLAAQRSGKPSSEKCDSGVSALDGLLLTSVAEPLRRSPLILICYLPPSLPPSFPSYPLL